MKIDHRLAIGESTDNSIVLFSFESQIITLTHTRLTTLFPGLPGWAGTRKVKPIWILLKQETVSGSGISRAICKSGTSLQTDNHASTSPLSFLQAGCPSCRPTNSVKALKAPETERKTSVQCNSANGRITCVHSLSMATFSQYGY